MDTKTLVKALKMAVREVIKEELTEILREGLQSTINEMKKPAPQAKQRMVSKPAPQKTPSRFSENKWASILNETEPLREDTTIGMNNYSELMNEGIDEILFTSRDAQGLGMMRQTMQNAYAPTPQAPTVMEDPETGKVYDVAPEVQQALTRDYSALMAAINKKKG
jgi:hypothetical protein